MFQLGVLVHVIFGYTTHKEQHTSNGAHSRKEKKKKRDNNE